MKIIVNIIKCLTSGFVLMTFYILLVFVGWLISNDVTYFDIFVMTPIKLIGLICGGFIMVALYIYGMKNLVDIFRK